MWLHGQGGHSQGERHYFLGGQTGVSFAYVTEMRTDCNWLWRPLFVLLLLRDTLGCSSCTPLPLPCFQEGLSEAWRREGKLCCPQRKAQSLGRKEKLSITREDAPNSATHLLRHLCHHGDQLAIAYPIRACFTQTSVEPGVLKADKCRTLGTGFILPPFSHTPMGRSSTGFPETVLCGI